MTRHLGRLQKKILRILETTENPIYVHKKKMEGWQDVGSLAYMVVHGSDCFDGRTDPVRKPTNVELQSIWRAIRTLEQRGLIEFKSFPAGFMERIGDSKGGVSHQKGIRLVQSKNALN